MQEIHHDSMTEKKVPKPHHHQILKCPRCESLNTKFCYYNNYNLSQPRHFCKGCRRYWTKGGLLRNITVGSGSRKPKRSINKNTVPSAQPPPPPPPPEPQSSSGGSSTLTESTSKMFAADQSGGGGGVFNEAESFTTSSMSSTNEAIDQAFGFGNSSSNIPDIPDTSSFWDGEFGSLDWQGSGDDQGLIDLSNYSVEDDDQLYWTHTHWSYQDNPALFHLP